jgi:hypothetical protein
MIYKQSVEEIHFDLSTLFVAKGFIEEGATFEEDSRRLVNAMHYLSGKMLKAKLEAEPKKAPIEKKETMQR